MEMTIIAPKSLSVAAALHPEVSDALDAAQQDALAEIRRWLGLHSVTRVGPRDAREIVPINHMQSVGISHKTSRAGDPHRYIHMQIGTRVWAAGKWRAPDTALFKQQGAIRSMGTAVIAAHPELAQTLHRQGLTLDPVSGEVVELEPFNAVMSKRSAQINRNLDRIEAEWEQAHPGEELGPVMSARLQGIARCLHRRRMKTSACRRSPVVRWIAALLLHRPGHATPCKSTSPESPPRQASRRPRCSCASSLTLQHGLQPRIVSQCCHRAWCNPSSSHT